MTIATERAGGVGVENENPALEVNSNRAFEVRLSKTSGRAAIARSTKIPFALTTSAPDSMRTVAFPDVPVMLIRKFDDTRSDNLPAHIITSHVT